MTDGQNWSLPNFVLGNILKSMKWPRQEGFLVKKYMVEGQILDQAIEMTLMLGAGLGAGHPTIALHVLASSFERDWSPAGVSYLMGFFDIADQLKAKAGVSPWKSLCPSPVASKVTWDQIWTDLQPIYVVPFTKIVGWALTHPDEVGEAIKNRHDYYEAGAPEAISHGLAIEPTYAWQTADEFYDWCAEIVELFESDRGSLRPVPDALANAPEFAHRFQ